MTATEEPEAAGPPTVGLPESLDRRLRLGPFPSARDALKFATWAAVGALVAAVAGAVYWLPFLGGGFLIAVYRHDGKSLDEAFSDRCSFHLRALVGSPRPEGVPPPLRPGGVARVGAEALVAVIAGGGVPVAFLPPNEARRLFDGFRDLLAHLGDGLYLYVGVEPVEAGPFRPAPGPAGVPEAAAREGYREMVTLLCRRRYRRRVLLVVFDRGPAATAVGRVEARATAALDGLARLGIPAERLRDRALVRALHEVGWESRGRP